MIFKTLCSFGFIGGTRVPPFHVVSVRMHAHTHTHIEPTLNLHNWLWFVHTTFNYHPVSTLSGLDKMLYCGYYCQWAHLLLLWPSSLRHPEFEGCGGGHVKNHASFTFNTTEGVNNQRSEYCIKIASIVFCVKSNASALLFWCSACVHLWPHTRYCAYLNGVVIRPHLLSHVQFQCLPTSSAGLPPQQPAAKLTYL